MRGIRFYINFASCEPLRQFGFQMTYRKKKTYAQFNANVRKNFCADYACLAGSLSSGISWQTL